jgi:integrase
MPEGTPRARRRTRSFGTVRRLQSGRWQVRWFDKAGDRHTAPQTFLSKAEASAWLANKETDLRHGDSTDPRKSRQTFAEWATRWQESRIDHAPKTAEAAEAILRLHVVPYFGRYEVADIDRSLVQRFVKASIDHGAKPNTVRNRYRVVYAVLRHAVENKALNANPAVGVRLGRSARKDEQVFLSAAQVEALADAISRPHRNPEAYYPEHGLRVRFAAYTGMRAGEIVALRAGQVDLMRRTVRVVSSTVVASGRVLEGQPTKTRQERTIKLPRFLAEQLAEHLGPRAADRNALVFPGADGGPMLHNTWYRVHFQPAVRQAGLDPAPRFHDLRHTCVALLVAQGAPILAISRQLGHSTIKTTMDTYGHVLPGTLDDVADRLDAEYARALSDPIRLADVRKIG